MPHHQSVNWFVQFYELNPEENRCIYFSTSTGQRCRRGFRAELLGKAIELRNTIIALPSSDVSLDLLEEYAKSNCCIYGQYKHRNSIEESGLCTALAQRWQKEIKHHTAKLAKPKLKNKSSKASVSFKSELPCKTGSPSSSDHPTAQPSSNTSSITSRHATLQSRYKLRPLKSSTSETATLSRTSTFTEEPIITKPSLEFSPHKAKPKPKDTVFHKLIQDLTGRDFEDGVLYLYERDSSPGYVKIGWTKHTAKSRLGIWEKQCGYTPKLILGTTRIPHAQRAEKLVHFELLKEWRRERLCKTCLSCHKEWFEMGEVRAKQVIGDWARFMEEAELYDAKGRLKPKWKETFEKMHDNNEPITAKNCLKLLEPLEAGKKTMIKKSAVVKTEFSPKRAMSKVLSFSTPDYESDSDDELVPVMIPNSLKNAALKMLKQLYEERSSARPIRF
jgi:hypothetical protein